MRARFAEEYVKDLSTTQAAIRAGYAPNHADSQGSAALRDPRVKARVAELSAKRLARVEIDSDFVLRRLWEEVNADSADLYDATGNLKPVRDWPVVWRRGLVSTIRTTRLYGRGADRGEEIGVQTDIVLVDRARRLELLGRHIKVGAFSDKVTVGLDTPLQELFRQIAGNVIRPASERQAIDHRPLDPGKTIDIDPDMQPEDGEEPSS
jgi:phage terminase small subunit